MAEIKEHLWEPLAIRNNGKLLLYNENRATWFVWVGPGLMDLKIAAFLFIEMDEDDRLIRFEVIRNKDGFFHKMQDCTSWGLCLDMEMLQFECSESLADDATYIFWGPKIKQSELEHPPDGQCQIITYLGNKSKLSTLRVQVDENPNRVISKKGFLRNIVTPGDHTLTADWPLCGEKTYKMWAGPIQLNISCDSGESVFVSTFAFKKVFRPIKLNMKIETTDEAIKIVRERQLILY